MSIIASSPQSPQRVARKVEEEHGGGAVPTPAMREGEIVTYRLCVSIHPYTICQPYSTHSPLSSAQCEQSCLTSLLSP